MTEYCQIELTRGKVVSVSPEDFERIAAKSWTLAGRYAVTRIYPRGDMPRNVSMHRFIMGAEFGQEIDHINGDGLDNRRQNLRFATRAENARNTKTRSDSKTGLKGIWYDPKRKSWRAQIKCLGKRINLGRHPTPEAAHAAYCEGAKKHFGEFARAS